MEPAEKLRRGIAQWLSRNELDGGTAFYGPEEWKARNEPYLEQSDLVLVFEGALYSVLNGHRTDSIKLYDEFSRFVRGFGYFFEFGHAWNMGFYPLTRACRARDSEQSLR